MLELFIDIVSGILLVAGSVFLVIGAVGLIRMPDVFTRMHAASVSDTLGAGLLILGMILQAGFTIVTVKLLIILAIFFFTGPLATHALARGALAVGLEPVLFDRNGRRRRKELGLIGEFTSAQRREPPPAHPAEHPAEPPTAAPAKAKTTKKRAPAKRAATKRATSKRASSKAASTKAASTKTAGTKTGTAKATTSKATTAKAASTKKTTSKASGSKAAGTKASSGQKTSSARKPSSTGKSTTKPKSPSGGGKGGGSSKR